MDLTGATAASLKAFEGGNFAAIGPVETTLPPAAKEIFVGVPMSPDFVGVSAISSLSPSLESSSLLIVSSLSSEQEESETDAFLE